jgi:hypothetical protein
MNNKQALIDFLVKELDSDNKQLVNAQAIMKKKPQKGLFFIIKSFKVETIIMIALHFKLDSLSDFGEFCSVSRERSRQVFKDMGINFKNDILSKTVYLENKDNFILKVKPLKSEEWKTLSCIPTQKDLLISNKGRIAKQVNIKIKGIDFNTFEFLNTTSDTVGRKRVSIPHGGNTNSLYLHRLVAEEFCEKPESLSSPIVRFHNEDYSFVESDNLYWCNRD